MVRVLRSSTALLTVNLLLFFASCGSTSAETRGSVVRTDGLQSRQLRRKDRTESKKNVDYVLGKGKDANKGGDEDCDDLKKKCKRKRKYKKQDAKGKKLEKLPKMNPRAADLNAFQIDLMPGTDDQQNEGDATVGGITTREDDSAPTDNALPLGNSTEDDTETDVLSTNDADVDFDEADRLSNVTNSTVLRQIFTPSNETADLRPITPVTAASVQYANENSDSTGSYKQSGENSGPTFVLPNITRNIYATPINLKAHGPDHLSKFSELVYQIIQDNLTPYLKNKIPDKLVAYKMKMIYVDGSKTFETSAGVTYLTNFQVVITLELEDDNVEMLREPTLDQVNTMLRFFFQHPHLSLVMKQMREASIGVDEIAFQQQSFEKANFDEDDGINVAEINNGGGGGGGSTAESQGESINNDNNIALFASVAAGCLVIGAVVIAAVQNKSRQQRLIRQSVGKSFSIDERSESNDSRSGSRRGSDSGSSASRSSIPSLIIRQQIRPEKPPASTILPAAIQKKPAYSKDLNLSGPGSALAPPSVDFGSVADDQSISVAGDFNIPAEYDLTGSPLVSENDSVNFASSRYENDDDEFSMPADYSTSVRLERKDFSRSPDGILRPIKSYESSVASASPCGVIKPKSKKKAASSRTNRSHSKRKAALNNTVNPSFESPRRSTNPFDEYYNAYHGDYGTSSSSSNGASLSSPSWGSPQSSSGNSNSLGSYDTKSPSGLSPTVHSSITSAIRGIGAQFMSSTRPSNDVDTWSVDSFSTMMSRRTISQRYRSKWQRPAKARASHQPLSSDDDIEDGNKNRNGGQDNLILPQLNLETDI